MTRVHGVVIIVAAACFPIIAQADYGFITLTGTTTELVQMRVTYSGVTFAPPACDDCYYDVSVPAGTSALAIRNMLIPLYGAGKLGAANRRVTVFGKPAFTIRNEYTYYVRFNALDEFSLVEPGVPLSVGGITVQLIEPPYQAFISEIASVPAVSTWGLVVLALVILSGAKVSALRRVSVVSN